MLSRRFWRNSRTWFISSWVRRIPMSWQERGEAYRLSLEILAKKNKVEKSVIFYNRFVELEELKEFIGAADLYITPYLNEAQITSGTLAYAFGAGKAVVSTPYWHAAELLAEDRGVLVPFGDSSAIGREVCRLAARCQPPQCHPQERLQAGPRNGVEQRGAALHALLRTGSAPGRLSVAKVIRHQDSRPATAGAAGSKAGPSFPDDRFHRHFPTRHSHRAEFFRRILHGRQRPRLHSLRAARRVERRTGTGSERSPPLTPPS